MLHPSDGQTDFSAEEAERQATFATTATTPTTTTTIATTPTISTTTPTTPTPPPTTTTTTTTATTAATTTDVQVENGDDASGAAPAPGAVSDEWWTKRSAPNMFDVNNTAELLHK
jgi:hypothetical protein